jgi:hypothetical protein
VRVWGVRGCESVVRYVVRLREIMELVRRCNFNASLGIVNRINKAGCTQNSVELCLCCEHVGNRQAVKQEVQGEWGSKETLASCSRG